MQPWPSDEEMFAIARKELFPAVVGDVMDKMGLLHQFLPPATGSVLNDSVQGLFAGTLTPEEVAQAVEDSVAAEIE